MSSSITTAGINLLKAGNKVEARKLLLQAVKDNPNDELAWLWLSGAVEFDEQRRAALERVLEINPANEGARKGLALLPPKTIMPTPIPDQVPIIAQVSPSPLQPTPIPTLTQQTHHKGLNPVCQRCGKEVNFLKSIISFNRQTGRCSQCESYVRSVFNNFRQVFLSVCADGSISTEEWGHLMAMITKENLQFDEALTFVRGDAMALLERSLTFAYADGMITADEARNIQALQKTFKIPDAMADPIIERTAYLRRVSAIREGKLPTVNSSVHLDADEICHLETPVVFQKITAKAVVPVSGRLIATSKQIHFVSPDGGWVIKFKSIMRVLQDAKGVYLELSIKRGNGMYFVYDPLLTEAMITTLVRIDRRQLLTISNEDIATRHIPHNVKIAVWQRDQGKCVQCSATSYLEYDHIIPHSKGGANTVNNVQLLCRKCNLMKSDSI